MTMMMMIRLIAFVFCLSLFLSKTSAQICNSLDGFNTHDLVTADEWKTSPGYGCLGNAAADCTFYFSFCQFAPHCNNEYSACENSSLSTNVTMIGAMTATIFFANEDLSGFYALFPAGPLQNISNTTSCTPSLRINFQCDPDAKWTLPIGNNTGTAYEPDDVRLDTSNPCETIIVFKYDGACHRDITTRKPSGGGGLSGGVVFLIILFSVLGAYFIIGIAYNGLVNHRSGVKLIPNSDFWIGLPLHAITGCRRVISCCSDSSSPSQASYDSV